MLKRPLVVSSSSSSVSLNDDDNHDFGAPPSNLALNQPAPIPGARSFVGRVFRFARDMSLPATVECNGGGRSSNGGGGEAERVLDSNSKNKEVSADVALFKGRSLKGSSHLDLDDVPTDIEPPRTCRQGTSRYRGVTLTTRSTAQGGEVGKGRWKAQISIGGAKLHLGTFGTEEEAGVVRARVPQALHHGLAVIPGGGRQGQPVFGWKVLGGGVAGSIRRPFIRRRREDVASC